MQREFVRNIGHLRLIAHRAGSVEIAAPDHGFRRSFLPPGRVRNSSWQARRRALTVQVAIVGGGPAGLTAAIALAEAGDRNRADRAGRGATTIAPPPCWRAPSPRSTRSASGPRCRDHAAPLRVMRIVDDTSRLIRAPEVSFAADEIGLEAFGYNIENRHLLAALNARAGELASLQAHRGRGPRRRDGRRSASRFVCAQAAPSRRSS